MDEAPRATNVASPFSTGGGGSDFERRVGAYYLAMALLRSIPRGQDAGLTREVRFQRLYEGDPLDDLIILSDLPIGEPKLALQIKRDLAFGQADETFDKVMRASWETFKSPKFILGTDRFGIALGLYSKTIDEHYQSVLTWARNSASANDFLSRVAKVGLSNRTQQTFVTLIRTKLEGYAGRSVSDHELWGFLHSMVILHFDFQQDGSRDQAYIVEMLSHILPPERKAEATHLFIQLTDYAAEANRTAGSFDVSTLRQRLQTDGFPLDTARDCRGDLEHLCEHGRFVLGDIRIDIGDLILPRTSIVAEARDKMLESQLLELIGPPGVGKSSILKALVETQQAEGFAIVLGGDRLTGVGWDGFASSLQLTHYLSAILLAISSSTRPCIFIDGVDRISEPGIRNVVNDLLRTVAQVPLSPDGSRHWTVVVSAREENLHELHTWLDWRRVGQPVPLRIPELTSEELTLIAAHCSRLTPLFSLRQLEPIVKNPFMLSLLEDQRMLLEPDALPPVATEIEVSEVWWERLIGSGGPRGRARQQALLELGKRAMRSPGRRLGSEGIAADVLTSLESDRVLLRDPHRDVYRFSHDLLEDWVCYRVLNQHREELTAYLQDLGQPFGLSRAVQLLGASLLEKDETATWVQLITQIEQGIDLAPRWRQALLTAALLSVRAQDLLVKAEPLLMAEDARRLVDLLVALRTVEVEPDFSLFPGLIVAMPLESHDKILPLLMSAPVPRWCVWLPFMGWLLERFDKLPPAVVPEAVKLMEIWQQKTPAGAVHRDDIGKRALVWLKELENWDRNVHQEIEDDDGYDSYLV